MEGRPPCCRAIAAISCLARSIAARSCPSESSLRRRSSTGGTGAYFEFSITEELRRFGACPELIARSHAVTPPAPRGLVGETRHHDSGTPAALGEYQAADRGCHRHPDPANGDAAASALRSLQRDTARST